MSCAEELSNHIQTRLRHVITSDELARGLIEIPTPFAPIGYHLFVADTQGDFIKFDNKITIQGNPNRINIETGKKTTLAERNIVYVIAFN